MRKQQVCRNDTKFRCYTLLLQFSRSMRRSPMMLGGPTVPHSAVPILRCQALRRSASSHSHGCHCARHGPDRRSRMRQDVCHSYNREAVAGNADAQRPPISTELRSLLVCTNRLAVAFTMRNFKCCTISCMLAVAASHSPASYASRLFMCACRSGCTAFGGCDRHESYHDPSIAGVRADTSSKLLGSTHSSAPSRTFEPSTAC